MKYQTTKEQTERAEKERVWREREEEAKRIIDSSTSRNKVEDGDPKPVTIYVQFGTERLEPFVASSQDKKSGQNNAAD